MTLETVAVTGGNGTIGSAILADLVEHGYTAVNVSRGSQRESVSDSYLRTDLLDAGQTYGALAKADADAVIHMGTIPDPLGNPDHVVYESNVLSSIHVLEAADGLGLEAVCLASSINAMGSEHQERPAEVVSVPVDESHPLTPDDAYGLGKHAMEVTAAGFGRRPACDLQIAALRYPWVVDDAQMRSQFLEADRSLEALEHVHPATGRDVLFAYLAQPDAASVARRSIEASFDGYETFWTVAADTTAESPTAEVIDTYYPDATVERRLTDHEALIDCSKAERLLDWTPTHSWRTLAP